MSGRAWKLTIGLLIILCAGIQLWTVMHWTENFGSDEAVFGLMAKHILQGRVPTYRYGLNYLGSAESIFAAVFLRVLGPSVVSLRMSSVLLYLASLLVHAVLVKRIWGRGVAVLSTLVMAVPARWVLEWVYRPMGFSTILAFGPTALLLAALSLPRKSLHLARLLAIGALAGLSLWSNPSTMLYFGVLAAVAWLATEEWRLVHGRLVRLSRAAVGGAAKFLMPAAVLVAVVSAAIAVFVAECSPLSSVAATLARAGLLAVLTSLAAATLAVSRRRRALLLESTGLALGLLAGGLPVWRAWLFFGARPANPIMSSCPQGMQAQSALVFGTLVPALWGGEPLASLPSLASWEVGLWVLVATLATASTVAFFVRERASLGQLLAATPLAADRQPVAALVLLLCLPVLLTSLGGNTMDVTATRYLLISWQAGSVVLALFVVWLAARARIAAVVLTALWLAQTSLASYGHLQEYWRDTRHWFAPEATASLIGYLEDSGVSGAYAGYWLAYVFDYLGSERVIFAPLSGTDRYPEYSRYVGALPVQAYIFWADQIPEESRAVATMVTGLLRGDAAGPPFRQIVEQAQRQTVLDRRYVGNWDVWLLTDAEAPRE